MPSTGAPNVTLSEFTLSYKAANVAGAPLIKLTGCKITTGGIDVPQDGWISQTVDFVAKNYELTTV